METFVITGANRGIGLELTKLCLEAGRRVVATCRDPQAAGALRALAGEDRLRLCPLEVTDGESVERFRSRLGDETVDVLVNNAGVLGGAHQDIADMDYDEWRHTFEVNTMAPFRMATALLPNLRRSRRPRIVTLSSQMGSLSRRSTGMHAYRSSKAAVNKVMQVLAAELEQNGIIVCPVHPGWVRTDMGGSQAEISPQESAAGLFDLIESMTMAHSGRFWTWRGEEHPW